MNAQRPVYRFEIGPSSFRHTIPSSVNTVIVKQQKDGWEEEFWNEKNTYDRLQDLQGTVIPHLYGQGTLDGLPALILSEVIGPTLYDIARNDSFDIEKKALKAHLEKVFNTLTEYGAMYWDQKIDNFIFCDNGDFENSRVMVVDLEQVQFPGEFRPWQFLINNGGAKTLLRGIMDTREPNRPPTPDGFWMDNHANESASMGGPTCVFPLINRGDVEARGYTTA